MQLIHFVVNLGSNNMKKLAIFLALFLASPALAYTVKPGDTLTKIAIKNHTTVAELVAINSIRNKNLILVGQELQLNGIFGAVVTSTQVSDFQIFSPNLQNIYTVPFNAASTTVCAIQNGTGAYQAIPATYVDVNAGTSSTTVNTLWRGYVSAGRADMNAAATATLFAQTSFPSSTQYLSFGGPVPSSYYTSSTAFLTDVAGIPTSTLVMLPPTWWLNVTTTAITSSTGNCKFPFINF